MERGINDGFNQMKLEKNFWRNFLITLSVIGIVYGATAFFALRERKNKELRKKERMELRENPLVSTHREVIQQRDTLHPKIKDDGDDDDDVDPYDDPDFDDLIPGEEYNEEFVDRSIGDPELYENE